jgi:hypothetical protein
MARDNARMNEPGAESEAETSNMDHRQERIRIETQAHSIEGLLTLARDGYRSRVSDVLNASERDFLTLTDVTVTPLAGGPVRHHRFLSVARRHVVFAAISDGPGS